MAYIGNQLQTAQPNYQIIDDISGSFDGVTTTFALQVGGVTPAPFPVSAQHCIISVGGVVQEPDPTGTNGFLLSGSNIVFSSAPSLGESFFGTVLAGADYINVGASFPDGSVANPSITFDQDLDTGLYRSASGTTSISSNGVNVADFGPSLVTFDTGGSESARIDSSGRLLVGTSTSTGGGGGDLLEVASGVGNILITSTNASRVADQSCGQLRFWGQAGADEELAKIAAVADGTHGAGDKPTRLTFSTTAAAASSPTEHVRIDNEGSLSVGNGTAGTIGTVPGSSNLGVFQVDVSNSAAGCFLRVSRNIGSANSVAAFWGTDGEARVRGDGDLENTNNRYTGLSDIKFKQNIEDASSQWDDIKSIRVRKYELISNPERKQIGVIAQEVEEVSPGLVIERVHDEDTGETAKSVAYSVLYMKAVKALQEAIERIEILEAANTALETRLTALEEGAS